MAGVELAAAENGIASQFTASEEDGQHEVLYKMLPGHV